MAVVALRKGAVFLRTYVRAYRSDPQVLNKIMGDILRVESQKGSPKIELALLTGSPNRYVTLAPQYLSERYFTQLAIVGLENAQLVDRDESRGIYDVTLTLSGGEQSQEVRVFGIRVIQSSGTGDSFLTIHSKYKILVALYQIGFYMDLDETTEALIINACLELTPQPT